MNKTDQKILRLLMLDGHRTNAKLAKEIGLSESATLERVRRLEQTGVLQGFRAQVDPKSVGRNLEVITTFTLKNQSARELERFNSAMQKMDEVLFCAQVLGRYDYVAQIAVRDTDALQEFIHSKLIPLGMVDRMESLTVLKMIKRNHPPLPLEESSNGGKESKS